jgi:hypothetical protein
LKKSELAFHQVKQYAENIFVGDSSFKSIEKQRKRILKRIPESTMENDN